MFRAEPVSSHSVLGLCDSKRLILWRKIFKYENFHHWQITLSNIIFQSLIFDACTLRFIVHIWLLQIFLTKTKPLTDTWLNSHVCFHNEIHNSGKLIANIFGRQAEHGHSGKKKQPKKKNQSIDP